MNWHDTHIYGFATSPERFELRFDVDYILEWLSPAPGQSAIRFRIAPATWTFHDVANVQIALSSQQGRFSIAELRRTKLAVLPGGGDVWEWLFTCHEGEIRFEATGFHLTLRQAP